VEPVTDCKGKSLRRQKAKTSRTGKQAPQKKERATGYSIAAKRGKKKRKDTRFCSPYQLVPTKEEILQPEGDEKRGTAERTGPGNRRGRKRNCKLKDLNLLTTYGQKVEEKGVNQKKNENRSSPNSLIYAQHQH